jgi:hypothetical protein
MIKYLKYKLAQTSMQVWRNTSVLMRLTLWFWVIKYCALGPLLIIEIARQKEMQKEYNCKTFHQLVAGYGILNLKTMSQLKFTLLLLPIYPCFNHDYVVL